MTHRIRAGTRADVPSLPAIERAAAIRFAPFGLADVMGTVVTSLDACALAIAAWGILARAVVLAALVAACSGSGKVKTDPERTGTITTGSCSCCGQVVDVSSGQTCAAACARACNADASSDAGEDG